MQIECRDQGTLEKVIEFTITNEEISNDCQKEFLNLAKKVRIPGFRVGKVPLSVIENKYGSSVKKDLLEQKIRTTLQNEIETRQFELVDYPQITVDDQHSEGVEVKVELEIKPEIKLPTLNTITVEKEEVNISDEALAVKLQELQKRYGNWKKAKENHAAQKGDQLVIDFSIKVDNEVVIEKKKVKLVLADGQLWKEFEDHLYGLLVGSTQEFDLNVPDSHLEKQIAGKLCHFAVVVQELSVLELPELTDQWVNEQFNVQDLKTFKEQFRQDLSINVVSQVQNKVNNQILENIEKLITISEFPPKFLQKQQALLQKQQKCSEEQAQELAKEQLKRRFVIQTLASEGKITVNNEEVKQEIHRLIDLYNADKSTANVEQLMNNKELFTKVADNLFEQKLFQYLQSQVSLTTKKVDLLDFEGKNVAK